MLDEDRGRRLTAGEILFSEGDDADHAYIVETGRLEVVVGHNGSRRALAEVAPGSLIGEMALLDRGTRTATVKAIEPSTLRVVERRQVEDRLDTADPVLRNIVQSLMARYRDVIHRLEGHAKAPVAGAAAPAAARQLRIEQELERALERDQFVLHYQPIIRLSDDSIAGFEALIRWAHPERGLIRPDQFIPAAEECGAIVPMGHWILRTAAAALCDLAAAQPNDLRHEPLFMTVNLSSRQFSDADLVTTLEAAMRRNRLQAGRLRFEITESALLDRIDEATEMMERCTRAGARLAVDDFGTGYSALSYLYRLPVSSVKLSREFITDLARFPQCSRIVGTVAKLAREMGMDTVAEGIEQQNQATAVRGLGIDYGQGFQYAAAMPLMVACNYVRHSEGRPRTGTLRAG